MPGNFSSSPVTTGTPTAANEYNNLLSDAVLNAGDCAASTGSANAYVLSISSEFTAYAFGNVVKFKANFSNTAAATLNVNSLGTKNILRTDGTTTVANDLTSGGVYILVYDGTAFRLQSTLPLGNVLVTTKSLSDASTTQTIPHSLGGIPRKVRIMGFLDNGSTGYYPGIGAGVFINGGNQACIYEGAGNGGNGSSTSAGIILDDSRTPGSQTGIVSVDGTNVYIAWTKSGGSSENAHLIIEVEA